MQINTHTSHPSAFISSTFLDLELERKAVENALRKSNLNINAIDVRPASNESSINEILEGIKESDFVILIVGERYGSIIPEMTGSEFLSITKWEYEQAVKKYGKDVLVYFKKVESNDPLYYDDQKSGLFEEKKEHLRNFKISLSKNHKPNYFSTPEELAEEVSRAIIPIYRAGVKSLKKENTKLKLENNKLKSLGIDSNNSVQQGLPGVFEQSNNMALYKQQGYKKSVNS